VQGAVLTQYITVATAQGLGEFFYTIVRGVANFAGVAGPIGIATIASSAVHQGVGETIIFIALISVNLAIINLVPIPGLDGGRLLFIIIEGLRGKPISEKVTLRVTIAGMALLIALMLVISFHDVAKLIHGA
jgi:regulator of sigma E protease